MSEFPSKSGFADNFRASWHIGEDIDHWQALHSSTSDLFAFA